MSKQYISTCPKTIYVVFQSSVAYTDEYNSAGSEKPETFFTDFDKALLEAGLMNYCADGEGIWPPPGTELYDYLNQKYDRGPYDAKDRKELLEEVWSDREYLSECTTIEQLLAKFKELTDSDGRFLEPNGWEGDWYTVIALTLDPTEGLTKG